jgi:GNAT superfamily N-acetyltransferase
MKTVHLKDKNTIETFFRSNTFLHIYSLGDLDDFFWPDTTWHALTDEDAIQVIALIYTGGKLPCLHIHVGNDKIAYAEKLLHYLIPTLPESFHAHLNLGLENILTERYTLRPRGKHYKMALVNKSLPSNVDTSQATGLSKSHLSEILNLFEKAYPGNFFEPRMLETKQYFGIRHSDELIGIAGVHVYSRKYRVAALGNVTTHPNYRRKGYGTIATAKVCQSSLTETDHIGLNVKADNIGAIKCYENLGFEIIDSYGEFNLELKSP